MKRRFKSIQILIPVLAMVSSYIYAADPCLGDRPHLSIRVSQVELCWDTAISAWDQLQYRSTLTSNQWVALTPWLPGDGGNRCTNDIVPAGEVQRFYQVVRTNTSTCPHLDFDGGDYVVVNNSASLSVTQLTVEAWVRLDRIPPIGYWDNQCIVAKGNDRTAGSFYLMNNREQFHFSVGVNSVDAVGVTTPSIIGTGRWYHVGATYDGQTLKIYVDGALQGTVQAAVSVGNAWPVYFGAHPMAGWEYWLDGSLREVRLWNIARTESAIRADMNRRLSGSEAGLVGCWHLDESAGQIAHDATANGNHGQLGSTSGIDPDDPTWIPAY